MRFAVIKINAKKHIEAVIKDRDDWKAQCQEITKNAKKHMEAVIKDCDD